MIPETQETIKIDKRDRKLLSVLSENSRTSLASLAKHLKINRDTVKYKLERMSKLGIINYYYTEINYRDFGYYVCNVYMVLDAKNPEKRKEFIKSLTKHPNTKILLEYHDKWDIEWVLIAKGPEHLDELITDVVTGHTDVVIERSQLIVVENYPSVLVPYDYYKSFLYKEKKNTDHPLDEIDFKIIKHMSKHARATAIDIGKKVHLGPDAVIKRVNNLYNSKTIARYTLKTDLRKVGFHWYTIALQVHYLDDESRMKLKEFVKEHKFIMRCTKTLGTWDFLIRIATDNSETFNNTVKEIRREFSDIIRKYETWVTYKEHYYNNFPNTITVEDLPKEDY